MKIAKHSVNHLGVKRSALLALVVIATSVPLAALAEPPDANHYPIHLSGKYAVDDQFVFRTTMTDKYDYQYSYVNGMVQRLDPVKTVYEFEGAVRIISVDSKKQPVKSAFTVKKFSRADQNDAPVEVLPSGTVLIVDGAAKNPQTHKYETGFSLVKGELTPEQLQAAQALIGAGAPDSPTEDEMWGTRGPKPVGESWPLNVESVSKGSSMGLEQWVLTPDHSKSSMTLLGAETLEGKPWIRTKLSASSNKRQPIDGQPAPRAASLQYNAEIMVPVEPKSPSFMIRIDAVSVDVTDEKGPAGEPARLRTIDTWHIDYSLTPLTK